MTEENDFAAIKARILAYYQTNGAKSSIQILQQVEPYTSAPFRLIEVYISFDGYRSRICGGAHKTLEEARAAVDKQERRRKQAERETR